MDIDNGQVYVMHGFAKKNCCSFGFCLNEGGGPAQIFCHLFIGAFLAVQDSSIGDLVSQ